MRRELVLPRASVALKSSMMRVAARPRRIDVHYRTFPRRLLASATRKIPATPAHEASDQLLDAIIRGMPQPQTHTRPSVVAVWLIIAGVIGWWAAFSLTMERLHLLMDPDAIASCDFSPLVQCTREPRVLAGAGVRLPEPDPRALRDGSRPSWSGSPSSPGHGSRAGSGGCSSSG